MRVGAPAVVPIVHYDIRQGINGIGRKQLSASRPRARGVRNLIIIIIIIVVIYDLRPKFVYLVHRDDDRRPGRPRGRFRRLLKTALSTRRGLRRLVRTSVREQSAR